MDTKTMIRELESVEEKHKHDKVFTGQINIATMAHDVRKRLEELKPYEDTGLTPEQIRELLSRENASEITRSSRDSQFGECSQREVYMKAYEDALNEDSVSEAFLTDCKRVAQKYKKDNDGWVSVEERMPEKNEYFVDTSSNKEFPNGYYRRLEIAYMTDTVEYIHGYYDGYKWMDEYLDAIKNVVAWRIHEPYRWERRRDEKE